MIKPPKDNPRRAGLRVILEALAQATPVTAGLAHLYQFTHPSEMESQLSAWRAGVSDTLNTHEAVLRQLEEMIAPRLRISKTSLELALWLTEVSEDGLRSPVEFDDLQTAFKEIDKKALQEACHQLEQLHRPRQTANTDRCQWLSDDPYL